MNINPHTCKMRIYALMSGQLVLYVGKTTQSLSQRAAGHRCHKTCSSSRIPKECEWKIVLLREVPDTEGGVWERHYYDTLHPLYNERVPNQSSAEWCSVNQERWKTYQQQYYQAHKEAYIEREKKYRASK